MQAQIDPKAVFNSPKKKVRVKKRGGGNTMQALYKAARQVWPNDIPYVE